MKQILIFAGTTEGRQLAEYIKNLDVKAYVSVATDYGRECLGELENADVIAGRMDADQIGKFIHEKRIDLVIDATHPFAVAATQQIKQACQDTHTEYLRCLRAASDGGDWTDEPEGKSRVIFVESVQKAVDYLKNTTGRILIATGSKELKAFTEIENYQERCYVRVLSVKASVDTSIALGFEGAHLIAMQGPFSRAMNAATIRQTGAAYFVTKESGQAGGFQEKAAAAEATGAVLVVIGRPAESGKSLADICWYMKEMVGADI